MYVKQKCQEFLSILLYDLLFYLFFFHAFSDYAALLSQHSSLSPTTSTSIATGRFYFRKKALTYSFVTSPEYGFPTTLTFLDGQGNIIEEFPLRPTHFQVKNDMQYICDILKVRKSLRLSLVMNCK